MTRGEHFTFIAVDCQFDFTRPGGSSYTERPSVQFVRDTLLPWLAGSTHSVVEVRSDYRQPRPGSGMHHCVPGDWGARSELEGHPSVGSIWWKAMHNATWVRDGIGQPEKAPSLPYPSPERFAAWLDAYVPADRRVVLFGLTLDCCVLSMAQELYWRGRKVSILEEGTDVSSGSGEIKAVLLDVLPWASAVRWAEVAG